MFGTRPITGLAFGISTNKVKAEHKEKIRRYRLECFKVLWQAFQSDVIAAGFGEGEGQELFGTGAGISYSTSVAPNPPSAVLIQIRETALAVAQLAEQQLALEQQVDEAGRLAALAHTRLDNAAQVFKEFRERLGEIEKKVAPPTFISDEQAAQIGLAVKALAEQLTKKDTSKNYYQAVYQELYRRFGVSSYKRVRTGQFEAVMKFLEDWRVSGKNTAS